MTETSYEKERRILILGAGVIGLTIAHVLSADSGNRICIVAQDMPDPAGARSSFTSHDWASAWAAANWAPLSEFSERTAKWERKTFDKLWSIIPSGLVMQLPCRLYLDRESVIGDPWWKGIVHDFRILKDEELPPGKVAGVAYTTVSLQPMHYLTWLRAELDSRHVEFVVRHVASIEEAASIGGPGCIVINATGLGAKSLFGIADSNVFPARGQTITVNAPHVKCCQIDFSTGSAGSAPDGEYTYIVPRPDGTCILGGTFHQSSDTAVDFDTAQRIYSRCTALEPGLRPEHGSRIASHNVGLRPSRKGGARVEVEIMTLPLQSELVPCVMNDRYSGALKVLHAYGLGGTGFQSSWGVAHEVDMLLRNL